MTDDIGVDDDSVLTSTPETAMEDDSAHVSATDVAPSVAIVAVSTPIKYAPVIPAVKGHYALYCLVIKWLDNPGTPFDHASNACHQMAAIYKDLSSGSLIFNVTAREVPVNLAHSAKNVNAAEVIAKRTIGNPSPLHVYAIFNGGAEGASHGAGDTAHLLGALTRDVCHEVGHCHPTDLGHSGKYSNNDGTGKYLQYDDGTSFMGRFSSSKITALQMYLLGWLAADKVAQYDLGDVPTDFNVQNLFGGDIAGAVKAVLIPNALGRPVYLSMPQVNGKALLAIHLSAGKTSQRVQVFANQATYAGLSFVKIADGNGFVTVRVSSV